VSTAPASRRGPHAAETSIEPRLPDFYTLVERGRVTSSNDVAKDLAAADAPEGTLVRVREQTAGRGRYGRDWTSPPGNLYMSLILRPDCAVAEAAQIGWLAAIAVGEALASLIGPAAEIRHKWPNDVLVGGRKIAGILLESASGEGANVDWVVAGIGVNVAHYPEGARHPATDLGAEGASASVEDTLAALGRAFEPWYHRWRREGFAPVRAAWLGRAWRFGQPIEARLEHETLAGVFEGVSDTGGLVLRLTSGETRTISYGEVFAGP
jgi:BirA family biotin operon repressor/biotin-[acetyl-CoA-carboxylase] ligase